MRQQAPSCWGACTRPTLWTEAGGVTAGSRGPEGTFAGAVPGPPSAGWPPLRAQYHLRIPPPEGDEAMRTGGEPTARNDVQGGGLRSWSGGSWWDLRETEGTQPPPPNSPGRELRQHWAGPEAEPEATQAGVGFPAEEFCDNQQCRGGVCFTPVTSRMVRLIHQEMTATEGQLVTHRPQEEGSGHAMQGLVEAPGSAGRQRASVGRRVRLGARSGLAGLGEFTGLWCRPVPGYLGLGYGPECERPMAGLGGGHWPGWSAFEGVLTGAGVA